LTTFGSKVADIKLMSLAVVKEHCSVRFDGTSVFIIGKFSYTLWVDSSVDFVGDERC